MARGHELRPEMIGILEQFAELQPTVADNARIGRTAARVLSDEIVDRLVELPLEVEGVERDAEHVGDAAGVGRVGRRATALFGRPARSMALPAVSPPLLLEERCRAIRPARVA